MIDSIKFLFHIPLSNPISIFAAVLLFILVAKITCYYLKLPDIIGLIVLGVIVGPHTLNILDQNLAVTIFANTGLLYIMFMAGLELDVEKFKSYKNKSIIFGLLTFFIPLCIGLTVFYCIFKYNFIASFLIALMFSTHTLITYPMVSNKGESQRSSVAITIGGTIITDTLVLLILAFTIGIYQKGQNNWFFIEVIIGFIFLSFFAIKVVPYLSKIFFLHFARQIELQYAFVLLVVFILSMLAKTIGIDVIIGAFFAGLSLSKLISKRKILKKNICFVGNTLFIPTFLISIGMIVNISVISTNKHLFLIAIILVSTAIISKWIAAFSAQKIFNLNRSEGYLMFGLSTAHAAATLAIILIGFRVGILDEILLNSTIFLIIVSCFTAAIFTSKSLSDIKKKY